MIQVIDEPRVARIASYFLSWTSAADFGVSAMYRG